MSDIELVQRALERNYQGYTYLIRTEIILREIITKHLQQYVGAGWLKSRCTPDVREKYNEALKNSKSQKIWRNLPLTPLYFSDYPHLRIIIQRGDNWRDIFSRVFDDRFMQLLTLSESIRNSVAHNKFVTQVELNILGSMFEYLENLLGKQTCDSMLANSLKYSDTCEIIEEVIECLNASVADIQKSSIISEQVMQKLAKVKYYSWLDQEIIDCRIELLKSIYKDLKLYNDVERVSGYYYRVELYSRENNLEDKVRSSISEAIALKEEINAKSV